MGCQAIAKINILNFFSFLRKITNFTRNFWRMSFFPRDLIGERKIINIRNSAGHPTSGLRPSRGRVLSDPWKCPACPVDILPNLCRTTHKSGRDVPDVPGFAPKPSPGHIRGTPTTKFLYVFFVYRFFRLPIRGRKITTNDSQGCEEPSSRGSNRKCTSVCVSCLRWAKTRVLKWTRACQNGFGPPFKQ